MKFIYGLIVGMLFIGLVGYGYLQFSNRNLKLSGNIITEERNVSGFNKIYLQGSGIVNLIQSEEESLKVTADENMIQYIETEVVGNELKLSINNSLPFRQLPFPQSEILYEIKAKDIDRLRIDGSGEINSDNLKTNKLEIDINGSGYLRADIGVNKLAANVIGSGTFSLTGTAEFQEITITGSGRFQGNDLEGKEGKATIEGSGKIELNVSEKLEAEIAGSGRIHYLGKPEIGKSNIFGSGIIKNID